MENAWSSRRLGYCSSRCLCSTVHGAALGLISRLMICRSAAGFKPCHTRSIFLRSQAQTVLCVTISWGWGSMSGVRVGEVYHVLWIEPEFGKLYDHGSQPRGSPSRRNSAVEANHLSVPPSNLRITVCCSPSTIASTIPVPAAALRYLAASSPSSSPCSVPGKTRGGDPGHAVSSASSTT